MMAEIELYEYTLKNVVAYDRVTREKIVMNRVVSIPYIKRFADVISEETIGRCVYVRVISEYGTVDASYPIYYDLDGNLINAECDPKNAYDHYSRALDECVKHHETLQYVPDLIRWLHDNDQNEGVMRL